MAAGDKPFLVGQNTGSVVKLPKNTKYEGPLRFLHNHDQRSDVPEDWKVKGKRDPFLVHVQQRVLLLLKCMSHIRTVNGEEVPWFLISLPWHLFFGAEVIVCLILHYCSQQERKGLTGQWHDEIQHVGSGECLSWTQTISGKQLFLSSFLSPSMRTLVHSLLFLRRTVNSSCPIG